MNRIIITTFDYKKQSNILAAKVPTLHGRRDRRDRILGARLFCLLANFFIQLMMTNAKKGVFQIIVDFKSLQIKNQVVTKC